MVIFHSYVSLPEGNSLDWLKGKFEPEPPIFHGKTMVSCRCSRLNQSNELIDINQQYFRVLSKFGNGKTQKNMVWNLNFPFQLP